MASRGLIHNIFNDILSAGISDKNDRLLIARVRFINAFSVVGISVTLFYGLVNILNQVYFAGTVEIILSIVAVWNVVTLRKSKNVAIASDIIVLILFVLLIFLLYAGGIGATGLYWFGTFPAITYFLKSKKIGSYWILAMFMVLSATFVLGFYGLITTPFGLLELVQMTASFLTISAIVYFYELISDETRKISVRDSRALQALNQQLSKEISERYNVEKKDEEQRKFLEQTKIAMLNILEDIDDEKNKSQSLAESLAAQSSRLKLATEAAKIGVWEWDVVKNELKWDDQMYALYGLHKEDFSGAYDAWRSGLHPDDAKRGDKEIQLALQGKKKFDTTFRIVVPGGGVRYIRAYAKVIRDEKKKPVKMVGINFDVTQEMEIDKAKSEFVSLASHQLRTPLSTINWYSEMLLAGDAGKLNKEQKMYLQEVYRGNQRMVGLVNALLNVSRIELGTFAIDPSPTDVIEVAEEIVKEVEPQIKQKKINFVKQCEKNIPKMNTDRKLLGIIFQNLLTNAVKYTPEKGTVTLKIKKDKNQLYITVSDTGYGIPKDQQKKIFTKLFRADNVREKETDGTGLGLYIVKSIVDEAKGEISFDSKLDNGTTFNVLLPFKGMEKKEGSKDLMPG